MRPLSTGKPAGQTQQQMGTPTLLLFPRMLHCAVLCGPPYVHAEMHGRQALRMELHVLDALHSGGCGNRVVQPVSMVRHPGKWEPPSSANRSRWRQVRVRGRWSGSKSGSGSRSGRLLLLLQQQQQTFPLCCTAPHIWLPNACI